MEVRFKVCTPMTDDHPPNVNAFSRLHKMFDGDKKHLSTVLLILIQHKHFF